MSGPRIGIADAFGGLHGLIQKWYLVRDDPFEHRQHLNGVITKVKKNTGDWWDDNDWNIFVDPAPNHDFLRRNSSGVWNSKVSFEANPPNAGLVPVVESAGIELEVHMPGFDGLDEAFKEGDWLQAYGWWVEDTAHADKTELHPVIWMLNGVTAAERFKIFVSQDTSGRFVTQGWPESADFRIPLHTMPTSIDPFNVAMPPQTTRVLTETARVDVASTTIGRALKRSDAEIVANWQQAHTKATIEHEFSELTLRVDLQPVGVGLAPMYFGDFQRRFDSLLEVEAEPRLLRTLGTPNESVLQISVVARLTDPEEGALSYSKWGFDQWVWGGIEGTVEELTDGPHEISYSVAYSPALGWTDTFFQLGVIAGTVPEDHAPGRREDIGDDGLGDPVTRAWLMDQVGFVVQPSAIELDVESVYEDKQYDQPDGSPAIAKCVRGYKVTRRDMILPDVQLLEVNWYVVYYAGASGGAIDPPFAFPVETDGEWSHGVLINDNVKVYCDDESAIELEFIDGDGSRMPSATGTWLYYPETLTRVRVRLEAETELGETITAETRELFRPACTMGRLWTDFVSDVERYAAAMELMGVLGLPSEPFPPRELLDVWPPRGVTAALEPLRYHTRVPEEARATIDSFGKLVTGRPMTATELRAVAQAAKAAEALEPLPERDTGRRSPEKILARHTRSQRVAEVIEPGMVSVVDGLFGSRSAEFGEEGAARLDPWVEIMQRHPQLHLNVAGYTDDALDPGESQMLAAAQVEAVVEYLVGCGVDADRLSTNSYGQKDPRVSDARKDRRELNNRIEMRMR